MYEEYQEKSQVTSGFCVNEYDDVYDEDNFFYCKWNVLTKAEKKLVKQNEFSAR